METVTFLIFSALGFRVTADADATAAAVALAAGASAPVAAEDIPEGFVSIY